MDEVKLLPCGNAGDAIDFACDHAKEPVFFLEDWRKDGAQEWPEYHHWLAVQRTGAAEARPTLVTDEVVGPSLGASADADRATHERGQSSVSPPAVGIPSAELHAAFMAGWLTGHHGNEPVDAWPVYLASLGGSAK